MAYLQNAPISTPPNGLGDNHSCSPINCAPGLGNIASKVASAFNSPTDKLKAGAAIKQLRTKNTVDPDEQKVVNLSISYLQRYIDKLNRGEMVTQGYWDIGRVSIIDPSLSFAQHRAALQGARIAKDSVQLPQAPRFNVPVTLQNPWQGIARGQTYPQYIATELARDRNTLAKIKIAQRDYPHISYYEQNVAGINAHIEKLNTALKQFNDNKTNAITRPNPYMNNVPAPDNANNTTIKDETAPDNGNPSTLATVTNTAVDAVNTASTLTQMWENMRDSFRTPNVEPIGTQQPSSIPISPMPWEQQIPTYAGGGGGSILDYSTGGIVNPTPPPNKAGFVLDQNTLMIGAGLIGMFLLMRK
jgi:hypothetical protein